MICLNLVVAAHVDHGKSMLCAALMSSYYGTEVHSMLDTLPVERKRGITVRAQVFSLYHDSSLSINLIDTPGHTDFQGETVKSINVADLTILLIDVTSGPEAQTYTHIANIQNLSIPCVIVFSKLDRMDVNNLPEVFYRVRSACSKLTHILRMTFCSVRNGQGIESLKSYLKEIRLTRQPHTAEDARLIGISYSKEGYLEAVIKSFTKLTTRSTLFFKNTEGHVYSVKVRRLYKRQVGTRDVPSLETYDIGNVMLTKPSTTLLAGMSFYLDKRRATVGKVSGIKHMPLFQNILVSVIQSDHERLGQVLYEIKCNDPYFDFNEIVHPLINRCYLCQYAGILHSEVVRDRLLDVNISTKESASLPQLRVFNQEVLLHQSSIDPSQKITHVYEPHFVIHLKVDNKRVEYQILEYAKVHGWVIERIGDSVVTAVLRACHIILGTLVGLLTHISGMVSYDLSEVVWNRTSWRWLEVRINGQDIGVHYILPEADTRTYAKGILRDVAAGFTLTAVPIHIQACVGNKVICSERIRPYSKDVTSKCYGGDQTRKDKLKRRQAAGKRSLVKKSKVTFKREVYLKE